MKKGNSPSSGTNAAMEPIATAVSPFVHRQDAPRQGTVEGGGRAVIRLNNPELAAGLDGLEGFERIWLIFLFHKNRDWHSKTSPPRNAGQRVGVFASRSPYRPNRIGMSCVRLTGISGTELQVEECDLLDGTPILDIKPYVPYCDSFPEARAGWTDSRDQQTHLVRFTAEAIRRISWIRAENGPGLDGFARRELAWQPDNNERKRLYHDEMDGPHTLAYRTWRLPFSVSGSVVTVNTVKSSYSDGELEDRDDPFGDRELHLKFIASFPNSRDPRRHPNRQTKGSTHNSGNM